MTAATIIERYRGPVLAEELAVVTAISGYTYTTDMSSPKFVSVAWMEAVTTATVSAGISGRTVTISLDSSASSGSSKKVLLTIRGLL